MRPRLYSVERPGRPGRLSVMARPRGGDQLAADLGALARAGVHVLIGLLPDSEARRLGLADERERAEAAGIEFRRLPVPDFGVPTAPEALAEARSVVADLQAGRHVAIHCRGGVGRSSTLAAVVLRAEGDAAGSAWAMLRRARGRRVPETAAQARFVESLDLG